MTIQRYTDCTQLKVDQWINLLPYADVPVQIARILPEKVEVKHYDPRLVNLMPLKRSQIARSAIGWVCDTYDEAVHMHHESRALKTRIADLEHETRIRIRTMERSFVTLAPQKFV